MVLHISFSSQLLCSQWFSVHFFNHLYKCQVRQIWMHWKDLIWLLPSRSWVKQKPSEENLSRMRLRSWCSFTALTCCLLHMTFSEEWATLQENINWDQIWKSHERKRMWKIKIKHLYWYSRIFARLFLPIWEFSYFYFLSFFHLLLGRDPTNIISPIW